MFLNMKNLNFYKLLPGWIPSIVSLTLILNAVLIEAQQRQQGNGNLNTNPYWHQEILDASGSYQLEWLVDWGRERVIFNVTVATRGWVGFGLASNSKMEGADIVIGGVSSNGTFYFSDRHAIGNQQPILDQSQDWVLHLATENATHTFLSFSRAFETCDGNDIPINDDALYLLWAYGERDIEAGEYHAENQGSFVAYLRDLDLTPRSVHAANQIAKVAGKEVVTAKVSGAQVWTLKQEFTIPQKRTTYMCNVHKFSPPTPGKKHMIGYNVWINPEAIQNMHHMMLFRCVPPFGVNPFLLFEPFVGRSGQECLNLGLPQGLMPTMFCIQLKVGHAIGGKPTFFPSHLGVPIGETSGNEYYVWQVHYDNPEFETRTINSIINWDIYYTESLRENDAAFLSLGHHIPGSPSILLPPGEQNHRIFGHCSPACTRKMLPAEGIKISGGLLHTHTAGRRIKIQHFRNGQELPWILDDDNYNFQFQPWRLRRSEVTVLPGDQVTVQCYYDTTHRNRTTIAGYGTDQEMCKTFLLYYSPLADYPICRSMIQSQEYMMRYLAGTRNVTWSNARLENVAILPLRLAGMTLSDISDSRYVNWDVEQRNQLRRDHIVHPQTDVCPGLDVIDFIDELLARTPPQYSTFPVQATEYLPPQSCRLN